MLQITVFWMVTSCSFVE